MEGCYVYITNPLTEDGKPIKHLICNGTNIFNDLIDPVTLCQYTGLTDKDGKKIWENDIISINAYSYDEPEDDYFGVVTYCEKDACWSLNNNEKYGELYVNVLGVIQQRLSIMEISLIIKSCWRWSDERNI